jgi:imidazolonepropionase-like amidohydrolase
VAAGVDIVAHLPASWRIGERAGFTDGSVDRWLLGEEDAATAARRDVAVVAHVFNGSTNPDAARIHAHNLALLKKHGVRLAIGSDSYRGTSLQEAAYLQSTGLFTPAEVLRIAAETTPRVIFPQRRIGRLEEGWEASFLVIAGDPIARPLFAAPRGDLAAGVRAAAERIRLRVKQGHVFEVR